MSRSVKTTLALLLALTAATLVACPDDPKRKKKRSARRYLLTGGLVRCGRCGEKMVSNPRNNRRRYICRNDVRKDGCGRNYIDAAGLEELVYQSVLEPLGMDLSCVPARGTHAPDDWWTSTHGIQDVVLELGKLWYYRLVVL